MRVLYCEDDHELLQLVELRLRMAGHEVESAAHADEAVRLFDLSIANNKPYDIIISDLMMDGHTGAFLGGYVRGAGYDGRLALFTGKERTEVLELLQKLSPCEYWPKAGTLEKIAELVGF